MKLIDKLAEEILQDLRQNFKARYEGIKETELIKAGMEKMWELVLEKSAGWFTEKQGDRLTSAEWQDFMSIIKQLANEEVEGGT